MPECEPLCEAECQPEQGKVVLTEARKGEILSDFADRLTRNMYAANKKIQQQCADQSDFSESDDSDGVTDLEQGNK